MRKERRKQALREGWGRMRQGDKKQGDERRRWSEKPRPREELTEEER